MNATTGGAEPLAWQSYRSAPAPGTRVIRQAELATGEARGVTLTGDSGDFPLLLDQRSPRILSQDGEQLRCTNHDASFSARSGEGLGGFASGCALDPVPVSIDADGWVVIGTA